MPVAQKLLFYIPSVLLGFMCVSAAITLSIAGLLLVRNVIPHHKLKPHNDVAGPIFGTLGTVYAVLLAFAVIIVWQNFDKSQSSVEREAGCLAGLYNDAEAFSPEFKKSAQAVMREYAQVVIDEEWKTIARGEASRQVDRVMKKMVAAYRNYLPQNDTEKIFFAQSVGKLDELIELRRIRLLDSRTGVHPLLWFVLVISGILTVSFTAFFGVENLRAQIAMASLLAAVIALILFTILSLDYPFTGMVTISADAFRPIISR